MHRKAKTGTIFISNIEREMYKLQMRRKCSEKIAIRQRRRCVKTMRPINSDENKDLTFDSIDKLCLNELRQKQRPGGNQILARIKSENDTIHVYGQNFAELR